MNHSETEEEHGYHICRLCNHLNLIHHAKGCGVPGCKCPGFALSYNKGNLRVMVEKEMRLGQSLEQIAAALGMDAESLRKEVSE